MSDFAKALPILLAAEGGWYPGNEPWDKNPTMWGVTQARYDAHRAGTEQPARSVEQITPAETETIYHTDYWTPSHADALVWPLSLLHFDFAVNAGPEEAIRVLQRVMDVPDDGRWGPQTAAAASLASRSMPIVGRDLLLERLFAYALMIRHDHTKVVPFVKEWLPRLQTLYRTYILGDA